MYQGGPLELFTSEPLGRVVSAGRLNPTLERCSGPVLMDAVIAIYRAYRDFWRVLERRRPWVAAVMSYAGVMTGFVLGSVLWGPNVPILAGAALGAYGRYPDQGELVTLPSRNGADRLAAGSGVPQQRKVCDRRDGALSRFVPEHQRARCRWYFSCHKLLPDELAQDDRRADGRSRSASSSSSGLLFTAERGGLR